MPQLKINKLEIQKYLETNCSKRFRNYGVEFQNYISVKNKTFYGRSKTFLVI